MSPDPVLPEVEEWFAKARDDLQVARVLVGSEPPHRAAAAFHCQQSVEKAVKGLLVRRGVALLKSHDIRRLAEMLPQDDVDLAPMMVRAAGLTEYVWRSRYPGDAFEPLADEIMEVLATAADVVETLEPRATARD
jgi:HEPN domain-containing protein